MKYDQIQIGDIVPVEGQRPAFKTDCRPSWYVVTGGRQRRDMIAAAAWLTANGATECWFPEDVQRKTVKRGHRCFREKIHTPIVPGVIFMLTDKCPQWDVIANRKRLRPLQIGDRPVVVSESVLAQMEQVPQRIQALKDEVKAAEHTARLAKLPHKGKKAKFVSGLLKGQIVLVDDIDGPDAIILIEGFKLRATLSSLERSA